MTLSSFTRVSVDEIPNLDAPPAYADLGERTATGLPLIKLPSGHRAAHLTRYADVHKVLIDPTFSRSITNVEGGPSFIPTTMPVEMLLNLDVPDHARMKKFVTGPYSAGGVEKLRPVLDQVITDQFAALRAADRPDLFRDVLDEVPIRVNSAFLGLPLREREMYRPLGHTVQRAPADDVPRLLRDFRNLYDYIMDIVGGKRPIEADGLIARFLEARHDAVPPLSDEELVAVLLGSILGADQNILSVLTKAVYTLLVSRPLWESVVAEPDIAPTVTEELIRLIPLGIISAFPRVSTRSVETSEGVLPENSVVYADAFAANRDPHAYPDPLVVDPHRTGPRHLQFGYGMHHCMGAALARMEITTVISRLTHEFPDLYLDADPATLPWDVGTVLRRPTSLPVRW
jgi:cytochrome P450